MREVPSMPMGRLKQLIRLSKSPDKFFQNGIEKLGDLYSFDLIGTNIICMANPEHISLLGKEFSWNIIHKRHDTELSPHILEKTAPGFLLQSEGYNHKCFKNFTNEQITSDEINRYISTLTTNFYRFFSNSTLQTINLLADPVLEDLIIETLTMHFYNFVLTAEERALVKGSLRRSMDIYRYSSIFGNIITSSISPLMLGFIRENMRMRHTINRKIEEASQCPISVKYLRNYLKKFRSSRDEIVLANTKLVDDILGLLIAGVETVSNSLAWVITILSSRTEYIKQIKEESDQFIAPNSAHDYRVLKYTRMVILETLRLYPSVPTFFQQVFEELMIDDMRIPPKSWILVPSFNIHRDSRWFPQPFTFDPSRWDPIKISNIKNNSFIPFGIGMHRCPGSELALAELSVLVSLVVKHFDISRPRRQMAKLKVSDFPTIYNGLAMKPKYPASITYSKIH